jgi:tRNA (guanine-N(7)-)-methyltransferase subunit TRM82
VIKLTLSPDHHHAVIVTDDKALRVFEIPDDGHISELSQRFMPKRPCAIQVLPDNSTILCGDKFGDVYSLPLLPQIQPDKDDTEPQDTTHPQEASKIFKPSASNLTVHTRRNLKSLEAQQKQQNLTPKTKEPLKFEHKLLLGHVSMLTDVCHSTQEVEGKQRGYIITADRDEHIRVSRGPPQSHIIEGYCLGHTEFVSKIIVVPESGLMISGGGDDWLGVWDWPSFKLRRKIHDFRKRVREIDLQAPDGGPSHDPIAVSGMWLVPGTIDEKPQTIVGVATKRSPVIAWFPVSELLKPEDQEISWSVEHMGCPVLDIACLGQNVLVSRYEKDPKLERLMTVCVEATGGKFTSVLKNYDKDWRDRIRKIEAVTSTVTSEEGLNDFLYGVESLRKRTYKGREENDEED